MHVDQVQHRYASVDGDVQDRALNSDRDRGGIGRDGGQPPVERLGDQVVEQLFLVEDRVGVATRLRSLAMLNRPGVSGDSIL
jgi:hypothetical protein